MIILSEYTRKILENFANINSGIVIRKTTGENGIVSIKSKNGAMMGSAVVEEKFPCNICLYDLPSFLNTYKSLGDGAKIDFKDNYLNIISSTGRSTVKILYTEPEMISHPKENPKSLPEPSVSFDIKQENLQKIKDISNIMGLTHFRIFSRNSKIILQSLIYDEHNASTNTFEIEAGDTDKEFSVFLLKENLKMIAGDYKVEIEPSLYCKFTNLVNNDLYYVIAVQDIQ